MSSASGSKGSLLDKEYGFSVKQGADWSRYVIYRPTYLPSFFQKIFDYHAQKAGPSWSVAHDVGAGAGIVSAGLSDRFANIVVSDPNEGYTTLARQALIERASLPESRFKFLQEGAEESSVKAGTVDLITACQCVHWIDSKVAMKQFHRQLKAGGTVVITFYANPRICGNETAQQAWDSIWQEFCRIAHGELIERAFRMVNTGLTPLDIPEEDWEGVKRVYINAEGNIGSFKVNNLFEESKVKASEAIVWSENDQDWTDYQDIQWFKGYISTLVPVLPESEVQGLWDKFESALQGKKAKFQIPVVMVFATRKA